jgi:hypothetical protein
MISAVGRYPSRAAKRERIAPNISATLVDGNATTNFVLSVPTGKDGGEINQQHILLQHWTNILNDPASFSKPTTVLLSNVGDSSEELYDICNHMNF